MKSLFFLLALIWSSFALPTYDTYDVAREWENFKLRYEKIYESDEEEAHRLSIFMDNLRKIEMHNQLYSKGEVSHTKGVNKFADLTSEEFLQYLNRFKSTKKSNEKSRSRYVGNSNESLPGSVDWRTKGCITEVKDQGNCGSCWAFSTTGSLESQLFLKKNKLISLSEQNLIDCSWDQGNEGCGGGLMNSAFEYIQNNGLESEEQYPYLAYDDDCNFVKNESVVSISGYVEVNKQESDLQSAVATIGPISVALDATSELQFYRSGILIDDSCDAEDLNHGVLLVGYDTEDNKDFYIIKNSWGRDWGENGFFRLGRRGSNPCGITEVASYPIVI